MQRIRIGLIGRRFLSSTAGDRSIGNAGFRRSPFIDHISLSVLGSSSATPTCGKAHASVALKLDSDVWIFDAGEGTAKQLLEPRVALRQSRISKIFVSHMHGDHVGGLLPLLLLKRSQSAKPQIVDVYGPYGIRSFLRANLLLTHAQLHVRFRVHELRTADDPPMDPVPLPPHAAEIECAPLLPSCHEKLIWEDIAPNSPAIVSAASITHTVPTLGFVITERCAPATLDAAAYIPALERNQKALRDRGVTAPLSLLQKLKMGLSVDLPDGTVLSPPSLAGTTTQRKICVLGDTSDASAALSLAQDADIVVHECTRAVIDQDLLQKNPMLKGAEDADRIAATTLRNGHSMPTDVAKFAAKVQCRTLLLTHFSPRHSNRSRDWTRWNHDMICKQVSREIAKLDENAVPNAIVAAEELMTIELPRKTKKGEDAMKE